MGISFLVFLSGLVASTAMAVPPNTPTNLTGNFNATNGVLTWTDNSTTEDMFKIDQATDSGFSNNLVTYNTNRNTTTVGVNGLTPGTTYWYRIRAFSWTLGSSANCAMNPSSVTTASTVKDILPSPWSVLTMGSPAPLTGNVSYQCSHPDPNVPKCQYTINGSGSLGNDSNDAVAFMEVPLYGDGEVVASVDGFVGTPSESAKAGVMIRESSLPGARYAATFMYPSPRGARFAYRLTNNATGVFGTANATVTPPCFVKVVRSGNTFSGYMSPSGLNGTWTQLNGSPQTIAMGNLTLAGLFVGANSFTTYQPVKFSNVSVKRTGDSTPFGGGMGGFNWYSAQRPFVDIMKEAETFNRINTTTPANVDADGWPTEDFQIYFLLPINSDVGQVYHLSANNVNANPTITVFGETVANKVYDSGNKTVTADIVIVQAPMNVYLSMNSTNGGAKNIRIIQPGYSSNTTEVFSTPFKELLKKASVIRFMDATCTNFNPITSWSQRRHVADPLYRIYQDGYCKGMPWELVVQLCNSIDRDMWINIPCVADDDYITKLAQLIKFGCRGNDDPNTANRNIPFTSAAEYSSYAYTKYPPLNANLNVYVEHSNETWNGLFGAYNQCVTAATGYYNHDTTYWHSTAGYLPDSSTFNNNPGLWHTKRLIDIRNLFVSGNGTTGPFAAEPSRIRAILAVQQATDNTGQNPRGNLEWVQSANGFGTAPKNLLHSIAVTNYHGAADEYFFRNGAESRNTMTAAEVLAQCQAGSVASVTNPFVFDVKTAGIATFYGLKMTGYEGGLMMKDDIRRFTANSIAVVHTALNDPAMATVMSTALNGWYQNAGSQFEYFNLAAGPDCSYDVTDDLLNLASMRIVGLDSVLTAPPPAVKIGYVGDNVNGVAITPRAINPATDSAVEISGAANLEGATAGQGPFPDTCYRYFRTSTSSRAHYLLNASAAGNYTLKLNVARSTTIDQTFDVAVNNVTVASNLTVAHASGISWVDSPSANISLNAGLNTIRVLPTGATDTNLNSLKLVTASGNMTQTMPFFSAGMPMATTKALNTAHTFTLYPSDAETAAGYLTVTGNSTNQTLVPNGNIVITGSGNTTRPVTITPATDQYGKTRINLTVSDGVLSRTAYYDLTVTPSLTGNQTLVSSSAYGGASGLSDPVNGIRAGNAFDGNVNTSWISPTTGFSFNGTWDNNGVTGATCNTQGHWVWMSLGARKHVERVKIVFGANYATSFKLQYPNINPSDGNATAIWYDLPGAPIFTSNNTQQTVDITGLDTNHQYLRLFVAERNSSGSGVEVKELEVYGTPPITTNTKINCGQTTGTPPTGWSLDEGYSAGSAADRGAGIVWDKSAVSAPVPDDNVYRYERFGACIYTVGGLTPGANKTVRLHFAESYFTAAGRRVFNVKINGTQVLTNFDIYAAAGALHKAVEQDFAATADTYGKVTIQFVNVTDNAQINGIEVN